MDYRYEDLSRLLTLYWKKKTKNNFEDNKIHRQFMNKCTNMEGKESQIERDQESRQLITEVRCEREQLRALAKRRNMSDKQWEKEKNRVGEDRLNFSQEQREKEQDRARENRLNLSEEQLKKSKTGVEKRGGILVKSNRRKSRTVRVFIGQHANPPYVVYMCTGMRPAVIQW